MVMQQLIIQILKASVPQNIPIRILEEAIAAIQLSAEPYIVQ
jgi:hypothetical protein